MEYLVDYHMHTTFSDGKDHYEDHILEARKKGIAEIGFTDHITLAPVDWCVKEIDYPVLINNLSEICANDHSGVEVKFGLEVDYFPDKEEELREVIAQFPVDYVIGSVHFLGEWNYDTDKSLYNKWTNDELYARYFDLVSKAAKSGLFDIMGHLDLIKKFKVWPESDQHHLFEKVIKEIKEADIAIELNTSGIDRPCNDFLPTREIVELAHENQVPITLGSDAHCASQVGRHFNDAINLLHEIGYQELATFSKRIRKKVLF